MPFTHEEFLDVFGRYNTLLWPGAVVLWLLSAAVVILVTRGSASAPRVAGVALTLHWAWSALAYHAALFTVINPAAWAFAALFLAQAVYFLRQGVLRTRFRFAPGSARRRGVAGLFLVYSLLYPAMVLLSGQSFPRAPSFGVPCPTTLFTAGILLAADPPIPRLSVVAPIVWALIGGSAALLFDVPADWALFVAAVVLALSVLRQHTPSSERMV